MSLPWKISLFSTFFLLIFLCVYADEDYYQLLNVPKDADDRTIRKAFKKLAIKMHPDKNTVCRGKARKPIFKTLKTHF